MIRFMSHGLLLPVIALLLAACDSGSEPVSLPGVSAYTLSVETVDGVTGLPATQTSAAAPLRVNTTLRDPAGNVVPNATISFSTTLGNLAGATAPTNSSGVASIILEAGSTGPAVGGTITARFEDPTTSVAIATAPVSTLGDESLGTGDSVAPSVGLQVVLTARNGNGAISATNPITDLNPGRLVATVTLDGLPVANALVTFTAPAIAILSQTTAATSAGIAEVTVTPNASGAGLATATAAHLGQTATASVVIATTETATAPVVLRLGSFNGTVFTNAVLRTSATGTIQAGSTITVSADVVDAGTGLPYTTPVSVAFTSDCASAEIDAAGTTAGGHTDITYRPTGCIGSNVIRATLTNGSSTLSAQVTVTTEPPTVGQIAFISAIPDVIALEGTGGFGRLTRSEVTFRVLGNDGTPINTQHVCFGLSTSVGGLTVDPFSTSNAAGDVIAVVTAGSVPTSVRVNAVVDNDGDLNCATVPSPAKSAVSDVLVVSTGLPHQDSFSLSIGTFNPQAGNHDGVTVPVFVYAADHFSNPVPDGTAVSFWTELGAIEPSCTTTNGTCSVNWRSQNLRGNADARAPAATGLTTHDRLNRSTIIAYAVGEESFVDADGDGRYDVGETYTDLSEVVKDSNYNGVRDTHNQVGTSFAAQFKNEEFVDFDQDGLLDAGDGQFDGVLCAVASAACSGDATVNVRDSGIIVMSTDTVRIYIIHPSADQSNIDYTRDTTNPDLNGWITGIIQPADMTGYVADPASPQEISLVSIADGTSRSVGVIVTDLYGNAPPAGTTVAATLFPADAAVFVGATTATVPSMTGPFTVGFRLARPSPPANKDGDLNITVTVPGIVNTPKVIAVDGDGVL